MMDRYMQSSVVEPGRAVIVLSARPVADKCLIMSEIMICPVGFC